MYLIYSALQHPVTPDTEEQTTPNEKHLRYNAYKAVCEKYRHEIAAIQKYFPNWKPRFDR
ncbi:hypothetical protein ACFQZS_05930 [Mucilaginibacter calamicampi]|uniref:Uncharacterized protein n=1 Tax=Mucilaginibacter calamicampi TaxID=1302352 RepID=A0ABW2YYY1_9SPHI